MRFAPVLLALALLAGGCGASDPPLSVTSVEVTNETDGFGALEVEVHVFDADTNEWLGCAGQDQGLEGVDASDVVYDVDAEPVDAGGNLLLQSDLTGRNVYVQVIEDDINPCPAAPDPTGGDDIIGTSGPLSGEALDGSYAFENVVQLDLAY